jgi:hypothetical protein
MEKISIIAYTMQKIAALTGAGYIGLHKTNPDEISS